MEFFVLVVFVCLLWIDANAAPDNHRSHDLSRRQDDCTGECRYCIDAWRLYWQEVVVETFTPFIVYQTVLEDGSVIGVSTSTVPQEEDLETLSTASTNDQGTRITLEGGFTLTFPTVYLSFDDASYSHTASSCQDPTYIAIPDLPNPFPVLSVAGSSPDDINGLKFELWKEPYTEDVANYLNPEAQTCDPAGLCPYDSGPREDDRTIESPSPALSAAFVTPTSMVTERGVGGNTQDSPSTEAPGIPVAPSGESAAPGQPAEPPYQASNPPTITGERMTTTNSEGDPIIVSASPVPTPPRGQQPVTVFGPGSQTLVITGGNQVAPAQLVTMTDSRGSVYTSAVQPGVAGGGIVTVTDVSGSVMVIQGGETGTLFEEGGETRFEQGGGTISNWQGTVAGEVTGSVESVSGGDGISSGLIEMWIGMVGLMLLSLAVTALGFGLA